MLVYLCPLRAFLPSFRPLSCCDESSSYDSLSISSKESISFMNTRTPTYANMNARDTYLECGWLVDIDADIDVIDIDVIGEGILTMTAEETMTES